MLWQLFDGWQWRDSKTTSSLQVSLLYRCLVQTKLTVACDDETVRQLCFYTVSSLQVSHPNTACEGTVRRPCLYRCLFYTGVFSLQVSRPNTVDSCMWGDSKKTLSLQVSLLYRCPFQTQLTVASEKISLHVTEHVSRKWRSNNQHFAN